MKTVSNLQKCKMSDIKILKWVFVLTMAFCCFHPSIAQNQTQSPEVKKEAELKRLEMTIGTAKAGLERAEKRAATADSLLSIGPELIKEGKAAQKEIDSEKGIREKGYKSKVKELDKQMKSKDKNEVAAARKEFKTIDTQYKAEMKVLAAKERDAQKKITTGENNKNKGKTTQKTSKETVKRAQVTLDAAQTKLDAAKGGDKSVKSKKKR